MSSRPFAQSAMHVACVMLCPMPCTLVLAAVCVVMLHIVCVASKCGSLSLLVVALCTCLVLCLHLLGIGGRCVWARLCALCAAFPPGWLLQCRVAPAEAVAAAASGVLPLIVGRLGWRLPVPPTAGPGVVGGPVPMAKLSVATGTVLQSGPAAAERRQQHSLYVRSALGLPPDVAPEPAELTQFARALCYAWQLKWENPQKDVLWRLSVDGIGGANSRSAGFKCTLPVRRPA